MVSIGKDHVVSAGDDQVPPLPDGVSDFVIMPTEPVHVADVIGLLKEQLMALPGDLPTTKKRFRLSYSILALEKTIDERRLTSIRLADAPGIKNILDRLREEIEHLRATPLGAEARPCDPTDDHPDALEAAPSSDPLYEIATLLRALQKSTASENRRHYASIAALYSAIERLSERMGRIEKHFDGTNGSEKAKPAPDPERQPMSPANQSVDPRPLLAAARAAAARALKDVTSPPAKENGYSEDHSPDEEKAPIRDFKSSEALPPRRRWRFSFAAA